MNLKTSNVSSRSTANDATTMLRQLFIPFLFTVVTLIASWRIAAIYNKTLEDSFGFTSTTNCTTTSTMVKTSEMNETKPYFDVITRSAYDKAIEKNNSVARTKFSLDGWERTNGGLDDGDREALGKLYYEAESVFEFGLGESTLIASNVSVPRYAGVDSDAAWVSMARENAKMDHFRFYFADIGQTRRWGYPNDHLLSKIAYNYQIAPLAAELEAFDVYLVDGRYRVACACASFLHAMKHNGDMTKILVGVHDNELVKRGYGVLQDIADLHIQLKRLWVYKLKPTATQEEVYKMWLDHKGRTMR